MQFVEVFAAHWRRRGAVMVIVSATLLAGCSEKPNTDSADYKAGYAAGHDDGTNEEHAQMCDEVQNFSDSIHAALQSQNICD